MRSEPNDGYYPALDGLRAAAVVAVMLYHGGVGWARGGYLGVDVFFVLSGFLITGLLVAEWDQWGDIDLARFWARRARRLLPALLVMLAVVSLLGPVLWSAGQRQRLGGDGLSALTYVANWRFVFSHQSYFANFAGPSPLQHTWSLAVEEQWYLLWPPLLLVLLRVSRRRHWRRRWPIAAVAAAGVAASAALMAVLSHPGVDPSRAYYGTDTRAQALLVGAFLALVMSGRRRAPTRAARAALGALGTAGAAVLVGLLLTAGDNTAWMYRGGFTLAAVAAAGVVAAATLPGGPVTAMLTGRLRCWTGRASYGLYLWHWPVFLAVTPARTGVQGIELLAVRLAVTAALAAASLRWVETPIRAGGWRWLGGWAVPASGVVAVSVAAGLVAVSLATPAAAALPAASTASTAAASNAATAPNAANAASAPRAATAGTGPRVLVLGDSTAFTLAYYWHPGATSPPLAVTSAAVLGCGLATGPGYVGSTDLGDNPACDRWPARWSQAITASRPQVAVIEVGAWDVLDRKVGGRILRVGTSAYARYLRGQLDTGLALLARAHAVVVLLDVPCYHEPTLAVAGDTSAERDDPRRVAAVNQVLAQAAAADPSHVKLIGLSGLLCPGGRDQPLIDGAKVRVDGVHYTEAGSLVVWRWLAPQLAGMVAAGGRHHP